MSQVCVLCDNVKPVNLTDNRLVTESCGHVKCMDCLLKEKSGCTACLNESSNNATNSELLLHRINDKSCFNLKKEKEEIGKVSTDCGPAELAEETIRLNKKLETSHVLSETDAKGRPCYLCTKCKRRFRSRSQVLYHAYCNGQRKPFQCLECKKGFASVSHYSYHMRKHRNEFPYVCEMCPARFLQMSKLQRHRLQHTNEKDYKCHKCGKAFNNVTSLRRHDRLHTKEQPYHCELCGKRFRDGSNFRRHYERHKNRGAVTSDASPTEIRKHKCPRCPQTFHSRNDMRRHTTTHTDSKPFRCKICKRCFGRKDNLKRHINTTHRDLPPSPTAIECDENALKLITTHEDTTTLAKEKKTLERLNPLPPLPKDVIQRHINDIVDKTKDVETSYILEANIARRSVIYSPVRRDENNEYVHKIRKATIMGHGLPPIDQGKLLKLKDESGLNNLEVEKPKNVELLKKILYDKETSHQDENGTKEKHWRRRMMNEY